MLSVERELNNQNTSPIWPIVSAMLASNKACVRHLLPGADRGGGLGRRRQHQLWGVHHHALQGEYYKKHRSSDWCNILNIYGVWGIESSLIFLPYFSSSENIRILRLFQKPFGYWTMPRGSQTLIEFCSETSRNCWRR